MKFDSNPVLLTCGVSADVSSYPVFWLVRTILDFSLQASALATLPDWSLHSRWDIRMPLMYVADPLLEYLEDFECASQYLAPVIAYRFADFVADFVVRLLSDAHLLLCGTPLKCT